MFAKIRKAFNYIFNYDPVEAYLGQSVDICDFERRLAAIQRRNAGQTLFR